MKDLENIEKNRIFAERNLNFTTMVRSAGKVTNLSENTMRTIMKICLLAFALAFSCQDANAQNVIEYKDFYDFMHEVDKRSPLFVKKTKKMLKNFAKVRQEKIPENVGENIFKGDTVEIVLSKGPYEIYQSFNEFVVGNNSHYFLDYPTCESMSFGKGRNLNDCISDDYIRMIRNGEYGETGGCSVPETLDSSNLFYYITLIRIEKTKHFKYIRELYYVDDIHGKLYRMIE